MNIEPKPRDALEKARMQAVRLKALNAIVQETVRLGADSPNDVRYISALRDVADFALAEMEKA